MSEIFPVEAWQQLIMSSLSELGRNFAAFAPVLLGAIVMLAFGWLLAKIVSAVGQRLLQGLGLDRLCDRLGLIDALRGVNVSRAPSQILAMLVFWLLMLTFVLSAFESIGLTAVSEPIDRLIAYLPHVVGAVLILIIGTALSRFVSELISSSAAGAGVANAQALGAGARGVMWIMVFVLALDQLGVDTQILVTALTALIAALAIGVALAFAVGARHVIEALLAGHYLRQSYQVGDKVVVEERAGVLVRVGPTETRIEGEDAVWRVPNDVLFQTLVTHPKELG
jgi:hypothetical protein